MSSLFVGKFVVVRSIESGHWAGRLESIDQNKVVLSQARRLFGWVAAQSITLSAVAKYGLKKNTDPRPGKNWVAPTIDYAWMEACEVLVATDEARESIMNEPEAVARGC
jgi:hypothetical protein